MSDETASDRDAGETRPESRDDEAFARSARPRGIQEVAAGIELQADELELYGRHVAKVSLGALDRLADRPNGRYIHVTSMTPAAGWEDPTITAIALAEGFQKLGKRSACCLMQPSLGTVLTGGSFGAGGGRCQVVPRDRLALHLTGDLHAASAAHALLSSLADAALVKAGPDGLDTRRMVWHRCQEVADPALRDIVAGLGGGGVPRESGFGLTPSSEVMAVLTLASSLSDLRQRLGQIVVGYSQRELPVFSKSLRADGAMAALMREAIEPNLMQTLGGAPVFVHGATTVDLSHGGSSVLADRIALKCCDYVVTASDGGEELGLEKFCDIKCRASGLSPDAVVLIATVSGVKYQSGRYRGPDDARLAEASVQAVKEGAANLAKHLENVRYFGLPCVVVIDRGVSDTDEELSTLSSVAKVSGASEVVIGNYPTEGGDGAVPLAEAVAAVCDGGAAKFSYLYDASWSITKKIETIATTLYNAGQVAYSVRASASIERYTRLGWQDLAVCMAKTVYSLSHDPSMLGRPYDFVLPVEDVCVAAGAGYLVVKTGPVQSMPGPRRHPRATALDIAEDGRIEGLFA
ncbi:MAG: formate--tetrahydrofolate ligase [Phycisphaerae bacterium]|nr:formate--tetrahydrofolate ligase [Phycisphaerae bacterium]